MAIILNDNVQVNLGKPVDNKYYQPTLNRPYTGVGEVNSTIIEALRYTGLTVNIGGVEYWYKDGVTDPDLIEKSGGVGTASNGLTLIGSDVKLGGSLTGDTTILGNGNNLNFNGVGIINLSATTINNISNGYEFSLGSVDAIFTDNSGNGEGIKYGADYTATFVSRSLVDKAYVDAVATGIFPKEAVLVATTGNTILSGLTTIDGILISNGDRVLVKNQTNAEENGVYISSGSTWSRSADFDGAPSGEVSQGALIPVLTGNTNISTSWILITADPITVGVTDLSFAKFSQLLNISGGNGIETNLVGLNQNISVDLATNSGLAFSLGQLTIDSNIAGSGLTWNSGVINVNASNAAINGTEIPIKFNGSNNLIVDSIPIATALGTPIITALNGLNKSGNIVRLGGVLTQVTTIDNSSFDLVINGKSALYNDDYSGTYVNRSIPDVGYVTGLTSGLQSEITTNVINISGNTANITFLGTLSGLTETALQTANNGLTVNGTNVRLGGTLTGNTCIDTGSFGLAIGYGATASGNNSTAFGNNTTASGCASISSGFGIPTKEVLSSGLTSFNHSTNNASQTVGHGALAPYSAILGGLNHNIEVGNTSATIIGGSLIKLTGTTYIDTTAVSKLALMTAPNSGSSDQVLVRNTSTGLVEYVSKSSLDDGVVSGATLVGATLNLQRTKGLPNVSVDLSSLSGETGGQEYTGATPSNITVGGLPAGSDLSGRSLSSIIEEMVITYLSPAFSSFSLSGYVSIVEVGTTLSGNRTFTWATSNSGNVQPSSVKIRDNTATSYLATGLTSSGVLLTGITTIQLNNNGETQSWRAEGVNTNLVGFNSSNVVTTGRYYRFYGPDSSQPTNSAQVRALPSSAFQTSNANTFILNTGTVEVNFYVALPPSITISSAIDLDAFNAPMPYLSLGTVSVLDAGGTSRTYNLYGLTLGAPYASNHQHQITTA